MKNKHKRKETDDAKIDDYNKRIGDASYAVSISSVSNTTQFQATKIVTGSNNTKYYQLEKLIIIPPIISTKEQQYDEGVAIAEHILTICNLHKYPASVENILVQPIIPNTKWHEKNRYKKAPNAKKEREIITEHTVLPDWPIGTVVIRGKTIIAVKNHFDSYTQTISNALSTNKKIVRTSKSQKKYISSSENSSVITKFIDSSSVIIDDFTFIESTGITVFSETPFEKNIEKQSEEKSALELPTHSENTIDQKKSSTSTILNALAEPDDETESSLSDDESKQLKNERTKKQQLLEEQLAVLKKEQDKTAQEKQAFLELKKRHLAELCRKASADLAKTETAIEQEKKRQALLENQSTMKETQQLSLVR